MLLYMLAIIVDLLFLKFLGFIYIYMRKDEILSLQILIETD